MQACLLRSADCSSLERHYWTISNLRHAIATRGIAQGLALRVIQCGYSGTAALPLLRSQGDLRLEIVADFLPLHRVSEPLQDSRSDRDSCSVVTSLGRFEG